MVVLTIFCGILAKYLFLGTLRDLEMEVSAWSFWGERERERDFSGFLTLKAALIRLYPSNPHGHTVGDDDIPWVLAVSRPFLRRTPPPESFSHPFFWSCEICEPLHSFLFSCHFLFNFVQRKENSIHQSSYWLFITLDGASTWLFALWVFSSPFASGAAILYWPHRSIEVRPGDLSQWTHDDAPFRTRGHFLW